MIDARELNPDALLHDIDMVYRDFQRRLRTTDQLHLDLNHVAFQIGDMPKAPWEAARYLVDRYDLANAEFPMRTLLKELPIEVRTLKGLKGMAYYFKRGELTEQAVLVTRKGGAYRRGARQRIAFDRAHELGHFIFDEHGIECTDEEFWCDEFALGFLNHLESPN